VGLHSAAWVTSLGADVVDVSGDGVVIFIAVAPETAVAPKKHEEFWNVPGRRVGTITTERPHTQVSPMMSKALSYKVKGNSTEEQPVACVVIGVFRKTAVTTDSEVWNFGFRASLRTSGSGFVEGAAETSAS